MKNSFCSGSRGSSSNSPNELAPQFLAATFSLHPFFLSSSLCLYNAGSVCVCVWARAFVCSCLEDMHKNALHFRFSLMRVCWWALFSALVFRKQWFPISSKPLPPPNHFPFGLPPKPNPLPSPPFTLLGGRSGIAPSLFYALSKVSLHILRQFCRLQLCMY